MPSWSESRLDDRRARLAAVLDERDLEAVWFAQPASFRWLTGGNNVVDRASEIGVAAAGIDADGALRVVTNNIEGPRLAAEELPDAATVETFPWHESDLAGALVERSPQPAAADFPVPGFDRLDPADIRQPLTTDDVETYRDLGAETAAIVESVCREFTHEWTENDVAAALHREFAAAGIETPVVLVGGSHRVEKYRHYTPTDTPLGRYALVSVSVERDGLFASCTRTVAFDAPVWLDERHERSARVEASALGATQSVGNVGGTAGEVFSAIQDAYAAVDHPGEWQNHHQGGAAGFSGREWIATPDSDEPVVLPMAYAWNPTIAGTKSEDTTLVTSDDVETLTTTGDWPTITATSVDGELTIDRPAVLHR